MHDVMTYDCHMSVIMFCGDAPLGAVCMMRDPAAMSLTVRATMCRCGLYRAVTGMYTSHHHVGRCAVQGYKQPALNGRQLPTQPPGHISCVKQLLIGAAVSNGCCH